MRHTDVQHVFLHPWRQVSAAVWQKYPNDMTPHVLTIDTLSCDVDHERRVLRMERLLSVRQNVPRFVTRFFMSAEPVSYVHEVTEVDLRSKTFVATSRNLTFRNIMHVDERVTYIPDPSVSCEPESFDPLAKIDGSSSTDTGARPLKHQFGLFFDPNFHSYHKTSSKTENKNTSFDGLSEENAAAETLKVLPRAKRRNDGGGDDLKAGPDSNDQQESLPAFLAGLKDYSESGRTLLLQEASVSVWITRVSSYLEELALRTFRTNAARGRMALQSVLDRLIVSTPVEQSLKNSRAVGDSETCYERVQQQQLLALLRQNIDQNFHSAPLESPA